MIKVTQEIPSERFCGKVTNDCSSNSEMCVFLDRNPRGFFHKGLDGFTCKRHVNVLLGIEREGYVDKIVKCHDCQLESEEVIRNAKNT